MRRSRSASVNIARTTLGLRTFKLSETVRQDAVYSSGLTIAFLKRLSTCSETTTTRSGKISLRSIIPRLTISQTINQLFPSEWPAPARACLSTHTGTVYCERTPTTLYCILLVRALLKLSTAGSDGSSLLQTTNQTSIPTEQLCSGCRRTTREYWGRRVLLLVVIRSSNELIVDHAVRVHHQTRRGNLLPSRLVARHPQH